MQNKLINTPQRMSMKKWNKHKNEIKKKIKVKDKVYALCILLSRLKFRLIILKIYKKIL